MVEHGLMSSMRDPDSNRRIPLTLLKKVEVGTAVDDKWEPGSSCADSDGEMFEKSEGDLYK